MSLHDIILPLLILAAIVALAAWRWIARGPDAYLDAYRKAQEADVEYRRTHPDCTVDEAHRHRDAVKRKFGRL